ncbi:MAG: hypothetical protein JWQ54_2853 [Mucilaginibacter sp.]|nr:hypothetical protein [Mucilaginibacter sp.]
MKDGLILVLLISSLIAPYLLIFYKKVNIRVRLLFICMIELFILCTLITIDFFSDGFFVYETYFYSLFVWLSILLNIILIFLSWFISKTKSVIKKAK